MKVTIKIGDFEFTQHIDDPEQWVTVTVDDADTPVVGIDMMYMDDTHADPCELDTGPHLVVGTWVDRQSPDPQWRRLAVVPLDGDPQRPTGGDLL